MSLMNNGWSPTLLPAEQFIRGVSKWGIKLLLLKTQHRCSVYNIELKGLHGVLLFHKTQIMFVLYIAQERKKTIAKEISSKHMRTRGCTQHAGPLFPHFCIPFNICTDSSANTD